MEITDSVGVIDAGSREASLRKVEEGENHPRCHGYPLWGNLWAPPNHGTRSASITLRASESDTDRRMRASPAEYLRMDLRAHDLLRDVPLYDVSVVDLPGGGAGRSVADIRALESAAAPSLVANTIYGLRHFLGRVFGWDHVQIRPEDSLLSRLSERDRRDSEITAGTPAGS